MKIKNKIRFDDFIKWTGSRLVNRGVYGDISSISTDTRTIEEGDFFIPIIGENFNGHDYIMKALSKGASGFVFEKDYARMNPEIIKQAVSVGETDPVILESNGNLGFLVDLAHHYIRQFDIVSIGITGSNGKTTTKEMMTSILGISNNIEFTPENFNNEIGVSKAVLEIDENTDYFIAEMGMRGEGQIDLLSRMINTDIGIITNIAQSHLEFFKSLQEIADTKAEIARILSLNNGMLFLNNDDMFSEYISKKVTCDISMYGRGSDIDYGFMETGSDRFEKYSFDFYLDSRVLDNIKINPPGFHNIYNACASAAVCSYIGISIEQIKKGIENMHPSGYRMKLEEKGSRLVLNDCYNANPLSVKKAIDVLSLMAKKNSCRSVAVLADMLELGKDTDMLHEEIGTYLSNSGIDILITFGKLAERINKGFIKKTGNEKRSYHFNVKKELEDNIENIIGEDDCILIKGSRKNKMETILKKIR